MPLTAKQAAFVNEYLIDLNATQAAVRAGYSKKTARAQGNRLLTNADIQAAVEKAQEQRAERVNLTADWVLERLKENHDRAMQAVPVMQRDGDEWVESGDYTYQGSVANKALELIGKHLGMFTEKTEHTGGMRIEVVYVDGD